LAGNGFDKIRVSRGAGGNGEKRNNQATRQKNNTRTPRPRAYPPTRKNAMQHSHATSKRVYLHGKDRKKNEAPRQVAISDGNASLYIQNVPEYKQDLAIG